MPTAPLTNHETLMHHDLHLLRTRLQDIYKSAASFEPMIPKPPILDTSIEINCQDEENQRVQENVPGVKVLKEAIKSDLERLETFLTDPESTKLPALSTNSPYLISVWNEVLCAPFPVVSIFRSFPVRDGESARPHQRAHNSPGVKIDVVCDGGRRWIRVNTVKNSRLLSELREIDSYLTDSEDGWDDLTQDQLPSLAQKEFDNSVLRMGRSLLAAAKENLVPGTDDPPGVTLRLTRLDPSVANVDPRIAQTVRCLREMGMDVELGERDTLDVPACPAAASTDSIVKILQPTTRVNLDLSALIALVSDLTHAPLPQSTEEANARFIPSQKYLDWKKQRSSGAGKKKKKGMDGHDAVASDKPGQSTHARALVTQVTQEVGKGLLQDMHDRLLSMLSSVPPNGAGDHTLEKIEFWTTPEARDRCHRILSKIGGPNERRRANALFPSAAASTEIHEEAYWHNSRYPQGFLPFPPIRIYPHSEPHTQLGYPLQPKDITNLPPFFKSLASSCRNILAQETVPHPKALPEHLVGDGGEDGLHTETALKTKANPRLTAHTVQSLLWGAELGWTTLTANKSSVKAILREMKQFGDAGRLDRDIQEATAKREVEKAALWLVDPRSLAEGQRADFE